MVERTLKYRVAKEGEEQFDTLGYSFKTFLIQEVPEHVQSPEDRFKFTYGNTPIASGTRGANYLTFRPYVDPETESEYTEIACVRVIPEDNPDDPVDVLETWRAPYHDMRVDVEYKRGGTSSYRIVGGLCIERDPNQQEDERQFRYYMHTVLDNKPVVAIYAWSRRLFWPVFGHGTYLSILPHELEVTQSPKFNRLPQQKGDFVYIRVDDMCRFFRATLGTSLAPILSDARECEDAVLFIDYNTLPSVRSRHDGLTVGAKMYDDVYHTIDEYCQLRPSSPEEKAAWGDAKSIFLINGPKESICTNVATVDFTQLAQPQTHETRVECRTPCAVAVK